MNVVIVFDHPYGAAASENVVHNRSYSAALLAAVKRGLTTSGHHIDLIDLHADGFNPVTSAEDLAMWRQRQTNDPLVLHYQQRLMAADHMIFIFPIWWEAMPALTKGFIDKVFVKGVLFDEGKGGRPFYSLMPKLKQVSLLTVMSTPNVVYKWIFGNPITKILFRGTFRKMGIHKLKWYNYAGMEHRGMEKRRQILLKTENRFARL
ncbi:NAD(P)H-dependent oxidoreductase [Paenibacillus sp. JDR-2]|uniref:NAD(P)H-dependent oxidoreductase n=1 Tax=Paenibacillus sp. (strain JDR-2) TaxID=324057 RepID=UPI000166A61E|nr:NAD(P)H-dependent oxidoreductase [Paenibacillus sp. JDR-2]ACT00415.1 NAD(P)H dehydrogenase (quinone) [Paenibacillus sp. JDR-2]